MTEVLKEVLEELDNIELVEHVNKLLIESVIEILLDLPTFDALECNLSRYFYLPINPQRRLWRSSSTAYLMILDYTTTEIIAVVRKTA